MIGIANPKDIWNEKFNNSVFTKELLIAAAPIMARHMRQVANDPDTNSYETLGTIQERLIKTLVAHVGQICDYFDDVFLTLAFLKVPKAKIAELFEDTLTPEQYYTYQYDNFLIRMVTSLDLCAKLGNLIFDLGIDESRMYPHKFYEHPRLKDGPAAANLKSFAGYLDGIKQERHRKVHHGGSKENMFSRVLFWEGLNKAMGVTPETQDPALEELTVRQIKEVVSEIDVITATCVAYVLLFFEDLLPRLQEILAMCDNAQAIEE